MFTLKILIDSQKLLLFEDAICLKEYPISTAKNGVVIIYNLITGNGINLNNNKGVINVFPNEIK